MLNTTSKRWHGRSEVKKIKLVPVLQTDASKKTDGSKGSFIDFRKFFYGFSTVLCFMCPLFVNTERVCLPQLKSLHQKYIYTSF